MRKKIIEFGSVPSEQHARAIELLREKADGDVLTGATSLNNLYLTDAIVKSILNLDLGAFYAIKYYLEQADTDAGRKLDEAATRVATSLTPVLGIIFQEHDLRCDLETCSKMFMDRERRTVVGIARHRKTCLLTKLAELNPDIMFVVVADDGTVSEMTLQEVLQIVQREVQPA